MRTTVPDAALARFGELEAGRLGDGEAPRVVGRELLGAGNPAGSRAVLHGLPLIDLRLVCDDPADYANPIEPSEAGGRKIAAAIVRLVSEHDFHSGRTQAFIA